MFYAATPVTRRAALKTLGAGAALWSLGLLNPQRVLGAEASADVPPSAPFLGSPLVLPPLGYAYNALEPHIDARTMQIHHTKHHQAYINQVNQVIADHPELFAEGPVALLARLNDVAEPARTTLRNQLGGHMNHTFFWEVIRPGGPTGDPTGALGAAINETFGSFAAFKDKFTEAALKRFGSGWAWLLVEDGKLVIRSTANQDSPLMDGASPVLGLDVWEHAYYLKYQGRRADYVAAFWNVVNWGVVADHFTAAVKPA